MDENFISDRNLLKYMKESDIQKIAELFSMGKFSEIIETYFKKQKESKKETIKMNLFEGFNSTNNNIEIIQNSNTNNFKSKSNKEVININKNFLSNNNNDIEINKFFNSSNNLELFPNSSSTDFTLNTNNNLNDINKESKDNNNPYIENIGIIEDYYNSVNDEKEFNYDLIDKCENDKYIQQIILTIVIYCLMRIKDEADLRNIFSKYNISNDNSIFPLILLKSKFNFKINKISICLDIYSQAIDKYNKFKDENIKDNNNIIYMETYKQDFVYFANLFNYLFAMNNIDSKIKKLYFEQKFCLYHLGFYSEGFKLLIELFNKYQNDIQIQFELGKDSILLSKYDVYTNVFEILQKSAKQETNEAKKLIIYNYHLYLQGLSYLAQQKTENARSCFTEILKNDSANVVVMNNNALLSIYENKSNESYKILNLIESPNQMNLQNDCIHENIKILKEKYQAENQK